MRASAVVFILIALLATSELLAGTGLFDGESESFWTRDHFSIIIARVDSVGENKDNDGELDVVLSPQATLGGAFDCSLEPKISLTCWYGPGGDAALEFLPKKDMLVIAVICRFESETERRIPNRRCPLLPNGQPMYVINKLDDPEIKKTLERIQKARAIAKKNEADEKLRRGK